MRKVLALIGTLVVGWGSDGHAQVDSTLASRYHSEIMTLCQRDGGRLWGVSLCGPIAFGDARTKTVWTSEPAPAGPPPTAMGFANTAVAWGGRKWVLLVWSIVLAREGDRARLLAHELFHRVQDSLGLMTPDGQNDHLDELEGRYYLLLEWRALAEAVQGAGPARQRAIADALRFRRARRTRFPGSAEQERREEIREGLAQYTGTVIAAGSAEAVREDVGRQLASAAKGESLVRTFGYPLGAAYGVLLDDLADGWRRRITADSDLGDLLHAAVGGAESDLAAAELRYDGPSLRTAEEERARVRAARIAELRRELVEGPTLRLPAAPGSFATAGVTPLPGIGTVFPSVRVTAGWGQLVAERALRIGSEWIVVAAPVQVDSTRWDGPGWSLTVSPGWKVRQLGAGGFELVRSAQEER